MLPTQLRWIDKRLHAGGTVLALVGIGLDLHIFPGTQIFTINDLLYKEYPAPVPRRDTTLVRKFFLQFLQENS